MKLGRFEKIEKQRKEQQPSSEPRPSSGRFDDSTQAQEPGPTALMPTPVPRFETDSAIEAGDLRELPMLRCAGCQTDNGKFEPACRVCGQRLDTPEALALNRELLAALLATRAEERERVRLRTEAEIEQQSALRAEDRAAAVALVQRIARETHEAADPDIARTRSLGFTAALGLVLAGFITHSWGWALLWWSGAAVMAYVSVPKSRRSWAALLRFKRW